MLTNVNTTRPLFRLLGLERIGPVPSCSGFTGPVNSQNYTVRALANLPGCLAANGNAAQIVIFNAKTGGSCVTATIRWR